ncbi:MAG: GNAT family N-acetyltransferase [Acidobacteria bacterium]|nr:GNAT family N-acetyltransferase [Acidobacteriota bacterium]
MSRLLSVLIRDFQPSDLPMLSKIDQECFPLGVSYSQEELAAYIGHRSAMTWVAEDQGSIVGFIVASREPARVGHIITIDVLEGWRRRGTGTELMNVAESWARKARLQIIYLETAEENLAAQLFYEARGYRKVDMVDRYYSDGQAAWVMVKNLE